MEIERGKGILLIGFDRGDGVSVSHRQDISQKSRCGCWRRRAIHSLLHYGVFVFQINSRSDGGDSGEISAGFIRVLLTFEDHFRRGRDLNEEQITTDEVKVADCVSRTSGKMGGEQEKLPS